MQFEAGVTAAQCVLSSGTMSASIQSAKQKLEEGLEILESAANKRTLLGLSLVKVHGALEDYLRVWMSKHPYLPSDVRNGDHHSISWLVILKSVRNYAELPGSLRGLPDAIHKFNTLRNDVAHGDTYQGTRDELEQYAKLVQTVLRSELQPVRCRGEEVTIARRAQLSPSSVGRSGWPRPRRQSSVYRVTVPLRIAFVLVIGGFILYQFSTSRSKERTSSIDWRSESRRSSADDWDDNVESLPRLDQREAPPPATPQEPKRKARPRAAPVATAEPASAAPTGRKLDLTLDDLDELAGTPSERRPTPKPGSKPLEDGVRNDVEGANAGETGITAQPQKQKAKPRLTLEDLEGLSRGAN